MLVGARLVTASETTAGKRWDEARIKSLTGGEPVTARFMRQDNFTFLPQFKLIFIGNHKPALRDVDVAMRRRIQVVPFTVTPARVDKELGRKLREEFPAILAWMIDGCLEWQRQGLNPPPSVRATTEQYFSDEDAVGRWLAEACELDEEGRVTTQELFQSWREWANSQGEYVGSMKRFASALVARKFPRWQDSDTRRMGFAGLRVTDRQGFGVVS
jgi:P4 family phage/plasmid primase-like protien